MSDFGYVPALYAEMAVEPRVLRISFGDGYEQRVGDGINLVAEKWTLSFTKRREIPLIEAQLTGYAGVTAFTWTNPKGTEIKVVCRAWSRTFIDKKNSALRASFEQVFEL